MDVEAVMVEIANQLREVDGWTVFDYPPGSVVPPAAIVGYPEGDFDQTYARGMDRWTLPVWVVVGRVSNVSARTKLSAYLSGGGARSVKALIDDAQYAACDVATVKSWIITYVQIGDNEYLAAEFSVDVVGSGE